MHFYIVQHIKSMSISGMVRTAVIKSSMNTLHMFTSTLTSCSLYYDLITFSDIQGGCFIDRVEDI